MINRLDHVCSVTYNQGSHSFPDKKYRTFQDPHEKFSTTFSEYMNGSIGKCFHIKKKKPEARRAESGGGILGEGAASPTSPLPTSYGVWGSVVSSPSGVWGRAPENLKFGAA